MRNRYLDLLRAAAIVRVVVYHLFGWPWLSIVFPAMGVMFALAGSLTAASLDKRSTGKVVTSRLRRLLPPLWLLGLIAVPAMLTLGWAHEPDGEQPFSPAKLVLWLVPVGDPPGSDKGVDLWESLWYVRAYLWFVLCSPLMYLAYKKLRWFAVVLPLVAMGVLEKTGFTLPDVADAAMWDFVTFGACWIAGFAHHDGRLARVKPGLIVVTSVVLGAVAMYWLQGHPGDDGYDLNDVAESQALWSLAFVLVVLRWQPPMGWLARVKPLDGVVTLLNGRAVTIYLWHNIAIDAVWPVLTFVALDDLGALDDTAELVAALTLTALAVLAFGWAEDLAARRRPQLFPTTDKARLRTAPAGANSTSDTVTTARLPRPGGFPHAVHPAAPGLYGDVAGPEQHAEYGLPPAGLALQPPAGSPYQGVDPISGHHAVPDVRGMDGQPAVPHVPVVHSQHAAPDASAIRGQQAAPDAATIHSRQGNADAPPNYGRHAPRQSDRHGHQFQGPEVAPDDPSERDFGGEPPGARPSAPVPWF